MDLPLSFQARLQDIEDTKRQLLEQLQAEKDLLRRKKNLLVKKKKDVRQIQQRCLLLKKNNAELDDNILAKGGEIQQDKAKLTELRIKQRTLQAEVDDMERQQDRNADYYDLHKKGIDMFVSKCNDFLSNLKAEIEDLRKIITKVIMVN
eukprot:c19571_g1_i2 orf=268-714(+)